MTFDVDKFMKQHKEAHQVKCPECGYVMDPSEDLGECGLITYHGEDGLKSIDCPNCEAVMLVQEVVDRTWEVKQIKSYFAVQLTLKDGITKLYDVDQAHQSEDDCKYQVQRIEHLKDQSPETMFANVVKIEVIEVSLDV